ncbi:MAG: SCE4755 family polysaccharide monooxygenase-like protein [Polyangiaceae bacterium]
MLARPSAPQRVLAAAALAFAFGALFVSPSTASAHFILDEPPASTDQDVLGSPQKEPPCGGGADNGLVTAYAEGQTITITIDETIAHPGHYRVALGLNGPADLPEEPPVTAGSTACGSTVIQDPPVFPVLADGELVHTSPFSGPQSFEVTLPAGVKCDHCTLQVLEFMSNHALNDPGGCFYHHCATVSIGTAPPTSVTSGGSTTTSSGAGGAGADSGSSGCVISAVGAASPLGALFGAFAVGGIAMAARRARTLRPRESTVMKTVFRAPPRAD